MMKLKTILLFLFITLLMSLNNAAFAAAIQPSSVEAGTVNKKIDKEVNDNILNIKNETKIDKKEQNKTQYENKLNNVKKIDGVIEKTGFILKKIEYQGNTIYSEDQLNKIISDKIGIYTELNELKGIMKEITGYYNNNGYITSFAYLPAQKIKDGILKISIVESKISNIKIDGNKWTKTGYLKNNVFKANGIKENQVFNVNDLKKSLGKINEMSYLKGRVILQKGEDNESTQIVLNVEDRVPLTFNTGWNNQGRDLIGVQRSVLTVGNENITGYGDRLYASNILASGTYGLNTNYFLPLGSYGTELRLGYGYSNVRLGKEEKSRQINGTAHDFNIGLIQPLYENKNFKVTSDISLDMLHARTNTNKNLLHDKYDLRVLRTGINAIEDDKTGRWISRLEVSTGLPMLGATTAHAPGEGCSKFIKINPSIVRVQALPYKTTGILKISGQYSPVTLLPVEQLEVGGINSVRGYKEGLNFGDRGYFINLELRKTIPGLPDFKYLKLKDRVALAAFYDQGMTRSKGIKANYQNFLQSVGFGFRINLAKYLYANLDFGIPLGKERTGDQSGMRFHFNISSDII